MRPYLFDGRVQRSDNHASNYIYLGFMECRDGGLCNCTQDQDKYFMTALTTVTLKEKDEIETKFDKALGTLQCFLNPTCEKIAQETLQEYL
jgi:hypothetical protein